MRWIGWLLLLLVVVAWVASELPSPGIVAEVDDTPLWRRTRSGWEHVSGLFPVHPRQPALHPGVVAAAELLLSMAALIALPAGIFPKRRTDLRRKDH
jgi:hypothetical protein